MHLIYIVLLNIFWIPRAKSESDQKTTEIHYDAGDTLVFSCQAHIPKGTDLSWHRVIYQKGGIKNKIPENDITTNITYSITAYEFDNGFEIFCKANLRGKENIFLSSTAIKLVYTGPSNHAIDEIHYNEEHPTYFTCNRSGEHVPINSTRQTIDGSIHTAPNIHDNYMLTPSDSGSVYFCSILETSYIKSGKLYKRTIYNMAKYIYTPKSKDSDLLLIGIYLELVICVILVATFLFLRCKRKKKNRSTDNRLPLNEDFEQSPIPNQIIYAELELPRTTGVRISKDTNDSTYSQIIGYLAQKH